MADEPPAAAGPQEGPAEAPQIEAPPETFEVNYSCLRCGTEVPNAELARLPEIKCICGFRVFTKVRPPVVKTVRAV